MTVSVQNCRLNLPASAPAPWWSWIGGPLAAAANSTLAADLYECARYGQIPVLSDPTAPRPPAPRAPQTAGEMQTWTPEQSRNTQADMEDYARRIGAWLRQKQDSGEWDPEGQLIPTWVWIAAGASLFLLLALRR